MKQLVYSNLRQIFAGVTLVFFIPIVSYYLVSLDSDDIFRIVGLAVAAILGVFILRYPYLGLAIVVASLLIVDILPPVPLGSSISTLMGGATLISFFLNRKREGFPPITWGPSLIVAGFLIVWMVLSNPIAALTPEEGDRNWIFTFVQLWILAWLATQLFKTFYSMRVLIWFYVFVAFVSVIYAILGGEIGQTINLSERTAGLAGGANTAARYFVVGLILAYYLRSTISNRPGRFLLLLVMGLFILGTLYTASRTGLLLLVASMGLFLLFQLSGRNQPQAIFVFILAIGVAWVFADNVMDIFGGIVPAIRDGSDTVGLRYKLWEAGFRMWLDHPLQGVGIGLFRDYLTYYGADLLPSHKLSLGAHNMYVSMLAETGFVGLGLFVWMLVISLKSLWLASRSRDREVKLLGQTWFVVFVIMLLGGITKHDHYDKLIWIVMGIASSSIWKKLPDEKN